MSRIGLRARNPDPCEKGPRHGRRSVGAHGERMAKKSAPMSDAVRFRTIRRSLRPVLRLLLLGGLSACWGGGEDETRHDRRSPSDFIGEQIYACGDGSQLDADFLADGLTLDLTRLPDGKPERLTAPATGLTFIGHKVNAVIRGGDMTIMREGLAPLQCRRTSSAWGSAP